MNMQTGTTMHRGILNCKLEWKEINTIGSTSRYPLASRGCIVRQSQISLIGAGSRSHPASLLSFFHSSATRIADVGKIPESTMQVVRLEMNVSALMSLHLANTPFSPAIAIPKIGAVKLL